MLCTLLALPSILASMENFVVDAEFCLVKQSKGARKSQTTLFSWKKAPSKTSKPLHESNSGKKIATVARAVPMQAEGGTAPPAPIWTFSKRKGQSRTANSLQVRTYIVARRFYDCIPLDVDAFLSFAKHVDDRGYKCFAAFFGSGA